MPVNRRRMLALGMMGGGATPLSMPTPVAYYKLEETGAADRADATGRGNTLTAVGSPVAGTGKLLNGHTGASAKYLKAETSADLLSGGGDFTIGGWMSLTTLAGDYTAVGKWNSDAANQREYMLAKQNATGNAFSFWLSSDGGVVDYKSVTASHWGPPSTGELHFVIAWYDSVANDMYIQVNGGAVNVNSTGLTTPPVLQGTSEFRIGDAGSFYYWVGIIDEIFKVNSILTRTQRDAIYNANNALAYPWVFTAGTAPLVVFDGDSLTLGSGITNQYDSYPTVCGKSLGRTYCWENSGVGGQTIAQINSDATTLIDPLVNTQVYTKNIYVLWGGVNDLRLATTAATAWTTLLSGIQARQAAGWSVVVNTMLPATGSGFAADYNTKRASLNTLIRDNAATYNYKVADVGADTTIGEDGDQNNATYYQADKIHLTAAGAAIVAGLVKTQVEAW